MSRSWLSRVILALGAVLATVRCSDQQSGSGILGYLPDAASLGDWEAGDAPETAEGEDLFRLIDGGAEIYYEYGFRRAAIQTYTNRNGKSINVELYEMENPASAYGAYTFKLGREGKPVSIGTEGVQEDYYLNFWKGNHVVTVIGFDRDQQTRDGLLFLARLIDARIPESGERPPVLDLFSNACVKPIRVTYVEGNIGLSNRHQLGTQNILGARQGVVHECEGYTAIFLVYADEGESRSWYERASDHFEGSDRFRDFQRYADGFSLRDEDDRFVYAEVKKQYLAVYTGVEYSAVHTLIKGIWKRIEEGRAQNG